MIQGEAGVRRDGTTYLNQRTVVLDEDTSDAFKDAIRAMTVSKWREEQPRMMIGTDRKLMKYLRKDLPPNKHLKHFKKRKLSS